MALFDSPLGKLQLQQVVSSNFLLEKIFSETKCIPYFIGCLGLFLFEICSYSRTHATSSSKTLIYIGMDADRTHLKSIIYTYISYKILNAAHLETSILSGYTEDL